LCFSVLGYCFSLGTVFYVCMHIYMCIKLLLIYFLILLNCYSLAVLLCSCAFVTYSIKYCFMRIFTGVPRWGGVKHMCIYVKWYLCIHMYNMAFSTFIQCGISVCTCTKWHFCVHLCKVVKFSVSTCTMLYFCVHVYMCRKLVWESLSTLFGNSLVMMRLFLWRRLSLKAGKTLCQVTLFSWQCAAFPLGGAAKMTSVRFSKKTAFFGLVSILRN